MYIALAMTSSPLSGALTFHASITFHMTTIERTTKKAFTLFGTLYKHLMLATALVDAHKPLVKKFSVH